MRHIHRQLGNRGNCSIESSFYLHLVSPSTKRRIVQTTGDGIADRKSTKAAVMEKGRIEGLMEQVAQVNVAA